MFHQGQGAAAAAVVAKDGDAREPPAEDGETRAAVAQMPNAYAQFLRVSRYGTVDGEGNSLPEARLNEIQKTLAFPTPVLPPPPKYDPHFRKGITPQHVLEQQTFGCPSGDFIRFKRQMREDEERKHHVSVKEYHKLQMSLLEHLCTVYDPTTLEGIQSIQNIGYEWKTLNQPES
jgi:hypothetical protein